MNTYRWQPEGVMPQTFRFSVHFGLCTEQYLSTPFAHLQAWEKGQASTNPQKESAHKDTVYALQEPLAAYRADFGGEIETLRDENKLLWVVSKDI